MFNLCSCVLYVLCVACKRFDRFSVSFLIPVEIDGKLQHTSSFHCGKVCAVLQCTTILSDDA